MFSRFLAVPFVLMALGCLYLIWEGQLEAMYLVPWVVILAIIFVSSPQIDWWWAKRNPQPMDPKLDAFLHRFFPYYSQLSIPAKKKFSHRVNLNIMATEFIPKAMADVPEDIKGLIAANLVMLTLGKPEFRFPAYEKVVVYPHPFPSPQYKEFHAAESFKEDGVFLFSLEQLIPGATQRTKYYNIALHEFIKVFLESNPQHTVPSLGTEEEDKLVKMSGFKMEAVKNYIGLPELDTRIVSINYFFTFPDKFKIELSALHATYQTLFNQDPSQKEYPILIDSGLKV
jgi:Mlc titration factor MtfA (ptsG expression regulator)